MTCSRCSSPLLNQLQFDRGLCAMCLTGSLSALVALAAESATDPEPLTRDREWKADAFSRPTEVM